MTEMNSPARSAPAEATTYRPSRSILHLGLCGTFFFSTMGVASTLAALWNTDGSFPRPRLAAAVFGATWGAFTLMGLWMLAAYFRERLCLSSDGIVQVGVFGSRTLAISDIQSLQWRYPPIGGKIVLRTRLQKMTVYPGNFEEVLRPEIMMWVRDVFPAEIQQGWETFEPCRPTVPPPSPSPSRTGTIFICLSAILAVGVCFYVARIAPGISATLRFLGLVFLGGGIGYAYWNRGLFRKRARTK